MGALPQPDLLAWPELHAAELRREQAEAAYEIARRRFHFAPHGQRDQRRRAMEEASKELLRAEVEEGRLRQGLVR